MKTITVNRKLWQRGGEDRDEGGTLLSGEHKDYCIMGYVGKVAFKLDDEMLRDRTQLTDLLDMTAPIVPCLQTRVRRRDLPIPAVVRQQLRGDPDYVLDLESVIMDINDKDGIPQRARETALKNIFKQFLDIKLEFTE